MVLALLINVKCGFGHSIIKTVSNHKAMTYNEHAHPYPRCAISPRESTKMMARVKKILWSVSDPVLVWEYSTHVSIQLIITKPLTILHRSKVWPEALQSNPLVRAVKDAAPMMNKMNPMATGIKWVRIPKMTLDPKNWNPIVRITKTSEQDIIGRTSKCSWPDTRHQKDSDTVTISIGIDWWVSWLIVISD